MIVVHVGKCGGSNLAKVIYEAHDIKLPRVHQTHWHKTIKSFPKAENITVLVRDPIKRYISVYKKWYGVLHKLKGFTPNSHYSRAINQYSKYYQAFPSPNDLAEALSDTCIERRELAEDAFKKIIHLNNSLNYHLGGFDNLLKIKDQIRHVIRLEHFTEDFEEFYQDFCQVYQLPKLTLDFETNRKESTAHIDQLIDLHLSELAIHNLRLQYQRDYRCLQVLCDSEYYDNLIGNTGCDADSKKL